MTVDTPLAVDTSVRVAPPARPGRRWLTFLGVVPFFAFAALFLLFPIAFLVIGSFQDSVTGAPTIKNYIDLTEPNIVLAYTTSIEISLVTAIGGGLFGFLLAYAVILGGLPRFLRSLLMTFSGVASNFAGIPLALAFTFTLGLQGLVTKLLLDGLGIDLYGKEIKFSIYQKLGLELVY